MDNKKPTVLIESDPHHEKKNQVGLAVFLTIVTIIMLVGVASRLTFGESSAKETFEKLRFVTITGVAYASSGILDANVEATTPFSPVLAIIQNNNETTGTFIIRDVPVYKQNSTDIGLRIRSQACGISEAFYVTIKPDQNLVNVDHIFDSAWCK